MSRRFNLLCALLLVLTLGYGVTRHRPAAAQTETTVADLTFRAKANGFGFENYGSDANATNLTSVEMRRLFGDAVCAQKPNDKGECVLIPPGQQWMDSLNKGMGGGHCEGMATLSLLFFLQAQKDADFGAPATPDITFPNNVKLQREIAYWFTTQATAPAASAIIGDKTPSELLDILIASMKDGVKAQETYTFGIFQRGFKNGHAITPYAVTDLSNGIFHVMVYDNNFPGAERFVEIDRNANTWKYSASINPNVPEALYEGDAATKTLQLSPTTPRLVQQQCPFCAPGATAKVNGLAFAAAAPAYNEISLETVGPNNADLIITDAQGHRLGQQGNQLFNEIPGARFVPVKSGDLWSDDPSPIYQVPTGIAFTITLDGSALKAAQVSTVTMTGPGYDLAVDSINLEPGEKDTLVFSADGTQLTYTPSSSESPTLILGLTHTGSDYNFEITGADIDKGGSVHLALDYDKGTLALNTTGNTSTPTFGLIVDRIDDTTEASFVHDGLTLDPAATAYIEFGKWDGKGDLSIGIDDKSDGSVDETQTEGNQKK